MEKLKFILRFLVGLCQGYLTFGGALALYAFIVAGNAFGIGVTVAELIIVNVISFIAYYKIK